MTKINDLNDLRLHSINTLNRLENKEIDIAEAGVTGKLYENIISTVKTQLDYCKMLGKEPNIPFMGNCTGNYSPSSIQQRRALNLQHDEIPIAIEHDKNE